MVEIYRHTDRQARRFSLPESRHGPDRNPS